MANQVVTRRHGDTFQARLFWLKAAHLLDDARRILRVGFENGPKGFDDLWVEYDPAKGPPDQFGRPLRAERFQCKWHATPGSFNHKDLTDPAYINASTTSLLQRALGAYNQDRGDGLHSRLALVTNHRVDKDDVLHDLVRLNSFTLNLPLLFDGRPRTAAAKVRKLWREHLGLADDAELEAFVACLGFNQANDSMDQLRERLDEACYAFGLVRPEPGAVTTIYDGNVFDWVGQRRMVFDRESFRAKCEQEGLLAPKGRSMVAFGVKSFEHGFDRLEDRCAEVLNLVPEFDDRKIRDESSWRDQLLPKLQEYLRPLPAPEGRLRLALDTHLTLAFAAGSILNTKSGRLVELEQRSPQMTVWSPDDAAPQATWPSWVFEETVDGSGHDIFCGVSLSRPVSVDVREFAAAGNHRPAVSVFAELSAGPSQKSVLCGAHAAGLAEKLAMHLQALRTTRNLNASRLHLFVAAPNGFTFELGRHAAALGLLTLYEYDFERRNGGGYKASLFLP
jgi:hypothetical protein